MTTTTTTPKPKAKRKARPPKAPKAPKAPRAPRAPKARPPQTAPKQTPGELHDVLPEFIQEYLVRDAGDSLAQLDALSAKIGRESCESPYSTDEHELRYRAYDDDGGFDG
jgi:hypothetical protein